MKRGPFDETHVDQSYLRIGQDRTHYIIQYIHTILGHCETLLSHSRTQVGQCQSSILSALSVPSLVTRG